MSNCLAARTRIKRPHPSADRQFPPLRIPVFFRVPLVPFAADNSRSDLPSLSLPLLPLEYAPPLFRSWSSIVCKRDPRPKRSRRKSSGPGESNGKTEDAMSLELWSITVTCSMRCAHRHASMSAAHGWALAQCTSVSRLPPSRTKGARQERIDIDQPAHADAPNADQPSPTARPT